MSEIYEIQGNARTVRQLLSNQKYAIDYYQREYKWETKQVHELIDDLSNKFLEFYEPSHERIQVEKYGHYFLGPIIISAREGQKFIIDGQQRLTTLSLILILLNNIQKDKEHQVKVDDFIFSEKYAKKSFNLNVEERAFCMEALFSGQIPDVTDSPESIQNIIARYEDINEYFPEELKTDPLPYFMDWLLENVHLVEITAYSDEDAYTIFETMNDRGLSLSPTDMLKGFLLANISDESPRNQAAKCWKEWIPRFQSIGKDDEFSFFKAWLRSQYAATIRERKRGAKPGDFDLLGTEYHRWVRDHRVKLGLNSDSDFARFIMEDMAFYARWYERIRNAALSLTQGMEEIYYNALNEFTLQYPILLSPLKPGEAEELSLRKIRVAASFIDIMIVRRIWNYRDTSASTMQYAMFLVMRDIRNKDPYEMTAILTERLKEDTQPFESGDFPFSLHGMNRRRIHLILARMTDYIERKSGMPSHYAEYISGWGRNRYEVEHIWADHYERHTDEFIHPVDFQNVRNRIGALLILPKSFNQSYGDLPYEKKLPHYLTQNLLARSLHPQCYEHNPGFLGFVRESKVQFEPYTAFKKAEVEKRQLLYKSIAEQIWNLDRLQEAAERSPQ